MSKHPVPSDSYLRPRSSAFGIDTLEKCSAQNAILREKLQNYEARDAAIFGLVKEIRRLLIYAKLTPPESRIYNRNQGKRKNRKKE